MLVGGDLHSAKGRDNDCSRRVAMAQVVHGKDGGGCELQEKG